MQGKVRKGSMTTMSSATFLKTATTMTIRKMEWLMNLKLPISRRKRRRKNKKRRM
jgi:hypothetical protein